MGIDKPGAASLGANAREVAVPAAVISPLSVAVQASHQFRPMVDFNNPMCKRRRDLRSLREEHRWKPC